jgi:hypothetical protein
MLSPAGDNVSGRLPKTEAEAALLRPAIRKLLRTIPETWAEFDLDGLTAVEDNALFCLVAAGMVGRRGWYRTSILNHPTCFEVRFQATGEGGFAQAIEQAIAAEYATWGDAWRAWKAGETRDASPFLVQIIAPQEWRLTNQGVIARGDLDGTNPDADSDTVFDYVLKRGFYGPGYWLRLCYSDPAKAAASRATIENQRKHTGQDWTKLPRPPVFGSGRAVELRTIQKPADDHSVNVANWSDGANAFAAAFGSLFESAFAALSKGQPSADAAPPQGTDLAAETKRRENPKTKRGRKPLAKKEEQCREAVLAAWDKAHGNGVAMKDFCRDHQPPLKVKELKRFVSWRATRNRRKREN